MSTKKNPAHPDDDPPDESDLFRRLMADAKPLTIDVVEPTRPRRSAKAHFSRGDRAVVLRESLEADIETIETQNGDSLRFQHPSVGRKTMRRLARGGYSVQAETDLHGLTAAAAKIVLQDFIADCRRRGVTCVRIVHGKGRRSGQQGPVLKRKVDAWLRRWEGVLAFVSARQVDGGTGAIYALLKNTPPHRS